MCFITLNRLFELAGTCSPTNADQFAGCQCTSAEALLSSSELTCAEPGEKSIAAAAAAATTLTLYFSHLTSSLFILGSACPMDCPVCVVRKRLGFQQLFILDFCRS
jgi:hypothetical protein